MSIWSFILLFGVIVVCITCLLFKSPAPDINQLWKEYEKLFWDGYYKASIGDPDEKEQERMKEIGKQFHALHISLELDGENFYLVRKETN